MLNVTFLVREICQSLHTTMRWGEVFVGPNILCYFGEQSVADGLTPNAILDDGKYILTALIEEEIATFILANSLDSSEVLLGVKRSGNGLWLSDHPHGAESENTANLLAKIATALQFTNGENKIDTSVISWTLGNVVHLDAQSAAVPHSGGRDRISPDLILSDQWDFDGLKFGDSGTLTFKVGDRAGDDIADDVTMLRIEYHVKSDVADSTKINFKLNGLDTVVGVATNAGVGNRQKICVLINHGQLARAQSEESGFEPESRTLKHTIAVDGPTIAIERIRLSFYKPDPIITWEIDDQLTRLRLKNTNFNQVLPGPVPIRWELISGKPVELFVCLLSWYHGYHGDESNHDYGLRIFHSLGDISPPIDFDHGSGTGRDGVLELLSTGVPPSEFIGPGYIVIGIYVAPVNNKSNRFKDRDESILTEMRKAGDKLPEGSVSPVGVSEAEAIGFPNLPGINFGTGEYLALRPISTPLDDDEPTPYFSPDFNLYQWSADKSCQIMLDDTFLRRRILNDFYLSDDWEYPSGVKVIKAWIPPEAVEKSEWAHAQGRALDLIAVNRATGEATPDLLPQLAAMASHLFDWIEYVPANPVTGKQAHIHVSRRFEAHTLSHPIIINNDLEKMAEAHWEQVSDFDDTELLDQLINRFPETSVCDAAFSYRYELLLNSINRLLESEFEPESYVEWKLDSDVVIRNSHLFLLKFPGKYAAENIRTLLFKILRRLEDSYANRLEAEREKLNALQADSSATEEQIYALKIRESLLELDRGVAPEYHEYAVRYPESTEGRLAFARLYALESERAIRADATESYLSFMRDYPDAPQWEEIAERARDRAVIDEQEVLNHMKSQAKTEDEFEDAIETRAAIVFRNQAEKLKDRLIKLLPDEDFSGPGNRDTATAYSDPNLARFLIEALSRNKYVAGEMESYYLDLYTELGEQIDSAMIQLRLAAIQIQVSELSDLIKKNHLEVTELVISEENKTREQIRKSFNSLAEGQDELIQAIETGFENVQGRFDAVDVQLKKIYDNTDEILVKSDLILKNQLAAKEQFNMMEAAILNGNELTGAVLKKVNDIGTRSSGGGSGSGGGWLGKTERWVSGGFKKIGKKATAELGNLTAENIKRWAKDPSGTLLKRLVAGKNYLEEEINRGIKVAKSSWLYRKINDIGEHLLLEDPGDNMEEVNPNSDFDDSGLPFDRPDFDPEKPVYFVNGVNNSRYEARIHAQCLADLQNVRVRLIYNYSQYHKPHSTTPPGVRALYGNDDLLECIYDKLWPAASFLAPKLTVLQLLASRRLQENPTARHLAHQIVHELKRGNDVRLVAHSQGTLICRNALLACKILKGNTRKVSCVLAGPALSDLEMISPNQLANLTWIVNRQDPIAPLLGMKATIKGITASDGLSRNEHNFSNDRGHRHGGITPSGKRTYVRMISPEHLNASTQRGNTIISADD